jgi:hypothetical protein
LPTREFLAVYDGTPSAEEEAVVFIEVEPPDPRRRPDGTACTRVASGRTTRL